MASFARIDDDWIVEQVIAVNNAALLDDQGLESESLGVQFCQQLYGADTKWVQTSYNGNIRKNFAGIGYKFDPERQAFIPPKVYDSWVLNEDTCRWDPPVAYPSDGGMYAWDEPSQQWTVLEMPAATAVRARNADGTFMADDPTTPDVNEAYVSSGF